MDQRRRSTAARASAVAAVLSVTVAGCGSGGSLAGTPSADPLTATAAPTALPSSSGPPWAPQPTAAPLPRLTAPPAHGATSLPWSLTALSADRSRLTIAYAEGSCARVSGVQVTESDAEVLVAVWATTSGGVCTASLRIGTTDVALAAPLGGRPLLHAPVSREYADTRPFG